jgi:hypothetical protein
MNTARRRAHLLIAVGLLALSSLACSVCNLAGRDIPEAVSELEEVATSVAPELEEVATIVAPEPAEPAPEVGEGPVTTADLSALDSYHLEMTWRSETEGGAESYEFTIIQEWVADPPAMRFVMSSADESTFIETITVGGRTWTRIGETWMESEAIMDGQELVDSWEGLLTDVSEMRLVGEERVNGVDCKHYVTDEEYRVTIPDPTSGGTHAVRVEGETWVAEQADLPPIVVRERMRVEGDFFPVPGASVPPGEESGTFVWEYDVTQINQRITIEAPQ